jgi:hypothetical protein
LLSGLRPVVSGPTGWALAHGASRERGLEAAVTGPTSTTKPRPTSICFPRFRYGGEPAGSDTDVLCQLLSPVLTGRRGLRVDRPSETWHGIEEPIDVRFRPLLPAWSAPRWRMADPREQLGGTGLAHAQVRTTVLRVPAFSKRELQLLALVGYPASACASSTPPAATAGHGA